MNSILISHNLNEAKKLSKLYRQYKLRRIYKGIYTDELEEPIEKVVRQNWLSIVPHIIKEGILSHRTAIECRPLPFGKQAIIFVTSTYDRTIHLPGLIIKVMKGENKTFIEPLPHGIYRSNQPRRLLENLTIVRGADYRGIKTINQEEIEQRLAQELRIYGETQLNQIRDEAKDIAYTLHLEREYKMLSKIISALLSTHPDKDYLKSPFAKAVAKKEPYDRGRVQLFESLSLYLKTCQIISRGYKFEKNTFLNLSRFESYFSNYIEGTEFTIDEAEQILFEGSEVYERHADSHDLISNFQLTSDFSEMIITPQSPQGLIDILQRRHKIMMRERPEKKPGQFKNTSNKAGVTIFVDPQDVVGTLYRGFEIYETLNNGIEKALFMHLMISEIHPFVDGNGRLSRIMMNAELVSANEYKIMIPTVHRDNYLNGLRQVSHNLNFRTYCKVMDQAQAYTASINWFDYGEARGKIEMDYANKIPDEGTARFNSVLRTLRFSEFPP